MAVPLPETAPASREPPALLSRAADFWLLGGFGIALWCVMRILDPFRASAAPPVLGNFARARFEQIAGAGGLFMVLLNYPHFIASYRIAYGRGWTFVRTHWIALLATPFLTVALLALGIAAYGSGDGDPGALGVLPRALSAIGLAAPFGAMATVGAAVMAAMIQAMYFSVGWHYSKQAYGCVVVEARYTGYPLEPRQRDLVRWGLHGVWLAAWVSNNAVTTEQSIHRIPYWMFGFPQAMASAAVAVGVLLLGLVLWAVVRENHRRSGVLPGPTVFVPYLAFLVWWLPGLRQREFHDQLVPVFHALQYAPFVWRMERHALRGEAASSTRATRLAAIALGLVVVGAIAFELAPAELDVLAHGRQGHTGAFLFTASIAVFLNLHHYAMDSVIWKMRDPSVREALA